MGPELIRRSLDERVADTEGLEALDREMASETAAQSAAFVGLGLALGSTVG
jgi:hypothetical protein